MKRAAHFSKFWECTKDVSSDKDKATRATFFLSSFMDGQLKVFTIRNQRILSPELTTGVQVGMNNKIMLEKM